MQDLIILPSELTPEEQIHILEHELRLNEEKLHWYNRNPLFADQLLQRIEVKKNEEKIKEKQQAITKIEKKYGIQVRSNSGS